MKVIIFAIVLIILTAMVIMIINTVTRSERLTKAQRRELYLLRDLMDGLDELAYEHREIDSILAPQVIDEIRKVRKALK